ncbi:MAG TPA: complex I subunit 5 family protein [Actinomadura sp.]|nr:complex I subunit 5 family protein [Actinomadura sp.]
MAGVALQAAVVTPILVATFLTATGRWLPRVAIDALAMAAVLVSAGLLAWVLPGSRHPVVVWLGDWRPHDGEGVGIPLVGDPAGVGLALLVTVLALAALMFSWRFFAEVQAVFHALLLLFVGAMCAFTLTGDLFDAFVFFELMSVVAYVLTGYKSEEPQSVHGALNFGVVNSIGAYLTLTGISLLYAVTGELGFAAIGRHLPDAHPALVVGGAALVMSGFLVKAAAVPFHFWLADAHAVAPTPVCLLFSGVMVELGVYAVARLYWTTFAGVLPAPAVARTLALFGTAAALLGAVMCLQQRHIKRLLAYSTVSHIGLLLTGVAVLDTDATAGAALYLAGHAGVKAALFLGAGALLNRYETVDEGELHGRGRSMPLTGALFLLAGLGLAGLPPFGTWAGKAVIEHAAETHGWWWLTPVAVLSSALTAGAVLRVWLRVFRGAGRPQPRPHEADRDDRETEKPLPRLPWTMTAPALALVAGALLLGMIPPVVRGVTIAAGALTDPAGTGHAHLAAPPVWTAAGTAAGLLSAALAVGVAVLGTMGPRAPRATRPVVRRLRALHGGHLGDYVAWQVAGVALLGVMLALPLAGR